MFLIGDIGGTKTRLAVISADTDFRHPLVEAEFVSAQYPDIESIIKDFLNRVNAVPEIAVLGVAGPVSSGRAKITNLPWVMDEKELSHHLHISSVRLINDLEAIGYAIPFLDPSDLYVLNDEDAVTAGNIAIIAPGTGLGEACLAWDGSGYRVQASEGGHADFAPVDSLGDELWHYLRAD